MDHIMQNELRIRDESNAGNHACASLQDYSSASQLTNTTTYKDRMKVEYRELKDRYQKLHRMLIKNEAGTLGFTLTCPVSLLEEQKRHMGEYLRILEIRAEIEKVVLE